MEARIIFILKEKLFHMCVCVCVYMANQNFPQICKENVKC